MKAINESSKLVAKALEHLKAIEDFNDWKHISDAIVLLEKALVKLSDKI